MSHSFESQLDMALDTRKQRRCQMQAELAAAETAIQHGHETLVRMQARFCEDVRAIIGQAVARANRQFVKRSDEYRLCEVSGYFTGPLYAGGSACNPIAFELRANGAEVGETLIVELTRGGMVEAFLGPYRPGEPGADTTRLWFAWQAVPLDRFNAETACDLLLRYVTAVTAQVPVPAESLRAQMGQ